MDTHGEMVEWLAVNVFFSEDVIVEDVVSLFLKIVDQKLQHVRGFLVRRLGKQAFGEVMEMVFHGLFKELNNEMVDKLAFAGALRPRFPRNCLATSQLVS